MGGVTGARQLISRKAAKMWTPVANNTRPILRKKPWQDINLTMDFYRALQISSHFGGFAVFRVCQTGGISGCLINA